MSLLLSEIDENQNAFAKKWLSEVNSNTKSLSEEAVLKQNYRRLTAVQAIRTSLIEKKFDKDAAIFFSEAQNDLLTSHVMASFGAWRPALQSLRSGIENTLNTLYYNDHIIELQLWSKGNFRLGFSELISYFGRHPINDSVDHETMGLDTLKDEYATLSKAVHASSQNFRMTDSVDKILLWSDDKSKLGMWNSRSKKVIEACCLLTICLNKDSISGTSLPHVRSNLNFAISKAKRKKLKSIHVHIPDVV